MKNIIIILGTRPEAIKLAPVILKLKENPSYNVFVCNTEQQKELSNQTLSFFGIKADFNLNVMKPNQSLPELQVNVLAALTKIYTEHQFDATIVQGDTMTVFCGGLVSFYNRIPVFHVEAGLRSYDLFEPFPEEALRQMVSRITDLHFAPTQLAYDALLKEGINEEKIKLTGNTVIDALSCLSEKAVEKAYNSLSNKEINLNDKLVLVTAHRRENHGERLDVILDSILQLAKKYYSHQFVIPVHPNPNVMGKVHTVLGNIPNVILTEPLDYPELVCIMKNAKLIITDSGGIQEEAPTFGVPLLVIRYETERTEGVNAGFSKLVGADKNLILQEADNILKRDKSESRIIGVSNPYGDGRATLQIEKLLNDFYKIE